MSKRSLLFISILMIFSFIAFSQTIARAEKIAIVFTGETHAALYPCSCQPEEGGLSRRMTAINELRKNYKDLILLDSGGMFAGGTLDRYNADPSLGKKRTEYNIAAIKLMDYDAIAIGDEEFNFGPDFLEDVIKKTGMPFLSSNIDFKPALPYMIKKIGNIDIGIISLSPPLENAPGIKAADPLEAAKKIVSDLKSKNVNVIIVLSHLGEDKDADLAKNVKNIDIIISSHMLTAKEPMKIINNVTVLQPSFEGKKLRVLTANLTNSGIKEPKFEEIPLDEKIADNPEIDALLPQCFANFDCRAKDFLGECVKPGQPDCECVFRKMTPVTLTVITPKECVTCNPEFTADLVKHVFPKLNIVNLDYESSQGQELVKKYGITELPAYLLGKEASRSIYFNKIKNDLIKKQDHYIISPSAIGMSFFASRQRKPNTIDIILDIYSPEAPVLLNLTKQILDKNPGKLTYNVYFTSPLPKSQNQEKIALDLQQKEEVLRLIAVKKYFPDKFWDYASCRLQNPRSSWWDDCLKVSGIDIEKIKACAAGQEGLDLLEQNNNYVKELKNPQTSVILLNNQEIFGISQQTPAKELEDIIFGRIKKQ